MSDQIEESPEMEKRRKAKAALKGAQSNIAETLAASEAMAKQMKSTAEVLERIARSFPEEIRLSGFWPGDPGSRRETPVKTLLLNEASSLRGTAV